MQGACGSQIVGAMAIIDAIEKASRIARNRVMQGIKKCVFRYVKGKYCTLSKTLTSKHALNQRFSGRSTFPHRHTLTANQITPFQRTMKSHRMAQEILFAAGCDPALIKVEVQLMRLCGRSHVRPPLCGDDALHVQAGTLQRFVHPLDGLFYNVEGL
jgi:hypothetical protein